MIYLQKKKPSKKVLLLFMASVILKYFYIISRNNNILCGTYYNKNLKIKFLKIIFGVFTLLVLRTMFRLKLKLIKKSLHTFLLFFRYFL